MRLARLVLLDDAKDFHQFRVGLYQRVSQQLFDLPVTAFLGQCDDPAHAFE